MLLSDLKVKQAAIITKIHHQTTRQDVIASRLETLGFVEGTPLKIIARGIFGGDPILVQIGFTRFALRKAEAEKIEIQKDSNV